MPRYLVGIDLGTTNTALAFVDLSAKSKGTPKIQTFAVPQFVAAGELGQKTPVEEKVLTLFKLACNIYTHPYGDARMNSLPRCLAASLPRCLAASLPRLSYLSR